MKETDVISLAVGHLNKKLKANISTEYYTRVQTWRAWWEGYVEQVHSYKELGIDNAPRKRELYRLVKPGVSIDIRSNSWLRCRFV